MPALFRVKKLTRYIIGYAYHEILASRSPFSPARVQFPLSQAY